MAENERKEIEPRNRQYTARLVGIIEALTHSSSKETRLLAKACALLLLNLENGLFIIADAVDEEIAKRNKVADALHEFDAGLIKYLQGVDERLAHLEKNPFVEKFELQELRNSLQQQSTEFAKHRKTLEDLEVFGQNKIAEWVKEKFPDSDGKSND
jgi:hypothetical protein